MRKIILSIVLTSLAGQAAALSCMRPDPIETFKRLAEVPEPYYILHGTISFDESLLPQGFDNNRISDPDPIPAQFSGVAMGAEGFTIPYNQPASLQIQCFGPWCGGAVDGMEAVFYVPASDPPVTLLADPCGGMIFPDPEQDVLEMLESCMAGEPCESLMRD